MADADEKVSGEGKHVEDMVTEEVNLIYDGEEEPELHMRTWIALFAIFVLNLVQVFALQCPPAVVSQTHQRSNQRLIRSAIIYWYES